MLLFQSRKPCVACQRGGSFLWGRVITNIMIIIFFVLSFNRCGGAAVLRVTFLQATKKTQLYLRQLLIPLLGGNQFFCHHAVFIHDVKDGGSGDSEVTMMGVSVLRYRLLVLQCQIDSHFCDTVLLPIA